MILRRKRVRVHEEVDGRRAMALAKAITIGRKRRRRGQLWPMPVRETDLEPIYVDSAP
jgi:hypothetical protein